MKIRIQDNSVRFRLTVKEVEELAENGRIERSTQFPAASAGAGVFRYCIETDTAAAESRIEYNADGVKAVLTSADLARLRDDSAEGVYFHFDADGERDRFMFFIEKDRPATVCDKPEHWIYEESGGKVSSTSPIRKA